MPGRRPFGRVSHGTCDSFMRRRTSHVNRSLQRPQTCGWAAAAPHAAWEDGRAQHSLPQSASQSHCSCMRGSELAPRFVCACSISWGVCLNWRPANSQRMPGVMERSQGAAATPPGHAGIVVKLQPSLPVLSLCCVTQDARTRTRCGIKNAVWDHSSGAACAGVCSAAVARSAAATRCAAYHRQATRSAHNHPPFHQRLPPAAACDVLARRLGCAVPLPPQLAFLRLPHRAMQHGAVHTGVERRALVRLSGQSTGRSQVGCSRTPA